MGSHPWKHVTSFDPDTAAALARAQRETFERGEFGFAHKMRGLMESLGAAGHDLPPLPAEPRAQSIDHARELGAESGTCSVLDVYDLGKKPAPGVAGPLPAPLLQRVCGSLRPTLAQAEKGLAAAYDHLDRGEAAYIVCYEDDEPAHLLFIGMSFD